MATTKILKYPETSMVQALQAVRNGMPLRTAAKHFNVPKTTLLYKYNGKHPVERKMGPKTIFTKQEETLIVKWIQDMAKSGFPISKDNFLNSITKLSKELNKPFQNSKPGRKWYENFLKRHPEISLRTPQNLTKSRSSVNKQQLSNWYQEVYEYLLEQNCTEILDDAQRIFNADESAFFLNPKGNKVLAPKGDKNVYAKVNSNEKECLTVLVNGNAAGMLAPPMIIFQYKRIPSELSLSVPKHWGIGISDSGWMNADTFYSYIANVFYPWAQQSVKFPIVFFVDGHVSHLSYQLSRFCSEKKIILVALFPNATHLIQPMDVAVFRTLKNQWKEQVHQWRVEHQNQPLRKRDFAPLLEASINNCVTPDVLKNGFRKCGLYPWNPQVVENYFSNTAENETTLKDPKNAEIKQSKNLNNCDINYLQFIETFIDKDTISLFHDHIDNNLDDWLGPESEKSLFCVWKKIRSFQGNITSSNKVVDFKDLIEEAEIVFDQASIEISVEDIVDDITECKNPNIMFVTENAPNDETAVEHLTLEVIGDSSVPPLSATYTDSLINFDKSSSPATTPRATTSTHEIAQSDFNTSPIKGPDKKINIISVHTIKPSETPPKSDPNVPSPFKRAFFWPETKNDTQKNKKEKIPTVVTSQLWQEYNKRKSEKKEKLERDKLERKKKREEKKSKKSQNFLNNKQPVKTCKSKWVSSSDDEMPLLPSKKESHKNKVFEIKKKTRIHLLQSSDSKEVSSIDSQSTMEDTKCHILSSEKLDDSASNVSLSKDSSIDSQSTMEDTKCHILSSEKLDDSASNVSLSKDSSEPKLQDYVIVMYENKYFPGQVHDISTKINANSKEYFVSAMTPSGPSGWKWPEIKDEIWYKKENVVEVISPPRVTNSRGVCFVKEMEKFK